MNYELAIDAEIPLKQIGEKIRQARLKAGITQEVLAKRAGCGVQTIFRTEHGKNGGMALQILIDIAAVLNVDWTTFYDFTDEERKAWK